MSERPGEGAREDLDAVEESTGEESARAEAQKEFEDDPARRPDDEEIEGLKGG